ncbi:hypothetical protein HSR122_2194 [Halapricum desulfuricans]|uniref:Uncharacterized protein n=2 Tax=Halapricum desulfuricans TaxID=2841257 RepID=A0A897NDQ0_9EURY|nr:hypothetical protein HSR122_2194 [Halapricum desulfuricans]
MTTHPSTLETPNRLLHLPSLAKLYQYGYWPEWWSITEGGTLPDSIDPVAGVPWEQRQLGLAWKDEYSQEDFEVDERWFSDEEAVTAFADRVTADSIPWGHYLEWYRTTAVSTYRLPRAAEMTDWTAFPDLPDRRPQIKDRFESLTNPRVGDFVRMAVLQNLKQNLPSITNLSTGPVPWKTDTVSLVITPDAGEAEFNEAELCPRVVLKKLAEYGYRPIDGWYDVPAVGYEPDDPMVPRRFKFARGQALQEWYDATTWQSPLFEDIAKIRESGYLSGVDWETLVACTQSQIITYRELYNLA